MAEIKSGLRGLLAAPGWYEAVQFFMRAKESRRAFVDRYVQPKPGDRILDVGCGPGELLRYLPDGEYFGFDPNAKYIERARRTFGSRGRFFAKEFEESDATRLAPVDIVVVSAVLHHMSDDQARSLFSLLRRVLRPGGRVVTIDNVFIPKQNPIAKLLISLDRGRNVRTPEGYRALAAQIFDSIETTITHKTIPPYTYFIMSLS